MIYKILIAFLTLMALPVTARTNSFAVQVTPLTSAKLSKANKALPQNKYEFGMATQPKQGFGFGLSLNAADYKIGDQLFHSSQAGVKISYRVARLTPFIGIATGIAEEYVADGDPQKESYAKNVIDTAQTGLLLNVFSFKNFELDLDLRLQATRWSSYNGAYNPIKELEFEKIAGVRLSFYPNFSRGRSHGHYHINFSDHLLAQLLTQGLSSAFGAL